MYKTSKVLRSIEYTFLPCMVCFTNSNHVMFSRKLAFCLFINYAYIGSWMQVHKMTFEKKNSSLGYHYVVWNGKAKLTRWKHLFVLSNRIIICIGLNEFIIWYVSCRTLTSCGVEIKTLRGASNKLNMSLIMSLHYFFQKIKFQLFTISSCQRIR